MLYYWDLYTNYWRLFVKILAQYRADLAIMIGAAALHEGSLLLFINIIFSNIRQLQGWTFAEVLMIYGLMTTTNSVWNVTLDVPHRIAWYIHRGRLDYLMVRPAGVLFQIAGESGLYPLMACLSFWFTTVNSLLTTVAWTAQFGRFPITIFGSGLQFALTWIFPFAMIGFYPVAFLLRGDAYRLYGLLALIVGWVFLGLALALWRVAIRHYQSTD